MAKKTTKYQVTFTLEIEGGEPEELVEEAVAAVIDEEIASDGTRCGVKFYDATLFRVQRGES